jgi:hypothetical protein
VRHWRAVTSEIEPPFQPDAALEDEQSFGVNSAQVRLFLGQLDDLDLDRAIDVWNGYGVAEAEGYAAALEEAQRLADKQRPDAWRLARESAAEVAAKRLGDPDFTGEIVEVLANVAGALVIRDLLSRHDFRLLQLPWTQRGDAAAFPPIVAHVGPRPEPQRRPLLVPIAGAIAALIVVAIVLAALNGRGPLTGVVDTGQPSASLTAVIHPSSLASGSAAPSSSTGGSSLPTPHATPRPTVPPGGGPTPAPPAPTPVVTPAPTLPPPTSPPTPPPAAKCAVVSLLDLSTVKAQARWDRAGFSGKVIFAPDTPPNYKIVWQSLKIGAKVLCSSNITVSNVPPPGA